MKSDYQLLLTTCPSSEIAESLACLLLEKRLVSCVNILPNVRSFYEWKGKITNEAEVLLFIKTRSEHYTAIEQTLLQQHPYEVPELIALCIKTGLPSYLAWLDDSTDLKKTLK
ncbi:divalent-cation tolerance protein CutA [Candidatus Halobeggiatoa sp. HSG11]|nr:divalent-cation tolerance protein CutA [Candidatus Halobeggiatoa sp. HSG11]